MSKISFVTVSDDRSSRKGGKYSETQDIAHTKIKGLGFSNLFFWKWKDIESNDFYIKNKKILDHISPDMNGRCYKPFVILEAIKSIKNGDFLIYNDVSPEHWSNFSFDCDVHDLDVIKNLCFSNSGILSTENAWYVNGDRAPHTHENFTTEICMNTMGMQKHKHSLQHASGMLVFQKNSNTLNFVSEWLRWNLIDKCASLRSFDNTEDYYHNDVMSFGKIGHRHDQSISGLLLNDFNIKMVKNPGGFNFYNFCRKDLNYEFIETNIEPSLYLYKNTLVNGEWVYLKTPRNPGQEEENLSSPLRLK